jgi:hypothetical protein
MPWQDKKGIWRDYYGGMHLNEGAALAAETLKKQMYFPEKGKKQKSRRQKRTKCTAANERFGATAAVPRMQGK